MVARDGGSQATGLPAAELGGRGHPGHASLRQSNEDANLRVNGDTARLPRQPHGMERRSAMRCSKCAKNTGFGRVKSCSPAAFRSNG